MAKVEGNIVMEGMRGKIGNIVFRRRGNKTTTYVLSERKKPLTEKQKEAQLRFGAAVTLAKEALSSEQRKTI